MEALPAQSSTDPHLAKSAAQPSALSAVSPGHRHGAHFIVGIAAPVWPGVPVLAQRAVPLFLSHLVTRGKLPSWHASSCSVSTIPCTTCIMLWCAPNTSLCPGKKWAPQAKSKSFAFYRRHWLQFDFSTCDKLTLCNCSLCISLENLSHFEHLLLIMETSPTSPPTKRHFISQLQFCILKASHPPTSRQPHQSAALGLWPWKP